MRSKWWVMGVVLLLATLVFGAVAWAAATTTCTLPDNVYRPEAFTLSSTCTSSIAYTNVRFEFTLEGPEDFADGTPLADIFGITYAESDYSTPMTFEDITGGIQASLTGSVVAGNLVGTWGNPSGFSMQAGYDVTTHLTFQLNSAVPLGDYTMTFKLVNLASPYETLATATGSFTLSADALYVGTTEYEYQFTTIQSAIDDADSGDTINVAAGTYNEAYSPDCALKIDKSVTLVGTGLPTVDGGARGKVVQVTADNVTLRGMKFVNANVGIGIYLYGVGGGYTCENAAIESCDVSNNNIGLFLAGANGATIDGNTFTDNSYRSIAIQQDSDNNVLRDNVVTMTGPATLNCIYIGTDSGGNTIGVSGEPNVLTMPSSTTESGGGSHLPSAIYLSGVGASNNTIQYNTIDGSASAIQIDGNSGTTTVSNNIIGQTTSPSFRGVQINGGSLVLTNNTLTNCVRPVEFWGAADVTISGNTINGSTYDGINCGSASGTITISGNTLTNIPAGPYGIHGRSGAAGMAVDNNEIYSSDRGIIIDGGCTGVQITNNNIHDNGFVGIELHETVTTITGNTLDHNKRGIETWSPVTAHFNNILFHQYGGLILHDAGTHDVEHNWWGDDSGPNVDGSGPGTGTAVVTNGNAVDYDPWTGMATGVVVADPAVPPGETVVNVTAGVSVTNTGTGTTGVIIAQYTAPPAGTPSFGAGSTYVDVQISDPGEVSSLTITFTDMAVGTVIYFYLPGTGWIACSPQTQGVGTITVVVTDTSVPTLAELLTGTVFAGGSALGNVNGDSVIDALDVRLCLQIATGYLTGTGAQQAAADVDQDGDVDMDDATILAEYIAGIRLSLPGGGSV